MSAIRDALFRTDDQDLAFQRFAATQGETPTSVIEPPLFASSQRQVGDDEARRCLKCLQQQCSAGLHIGLHLARVRQPGFPRVRASRGDPAVGRPGSRPNGLGQVAEHAVLVIA
jgi:hypothetical protein